MRFVVLFAPNPEYQTPADPAVAQAVVDAHLQYQLRLQRDGIAVAGGPFAEGDAHADLVGMTVLRVKDLATAQSIAMDDPAVIAGRMSVTVREWRLPAGRLP